MTASGHFGWPKIIFNRISHHLRSIRNFYFFGFFFTKWPPVSHGNSSPNGCPSFRIKYHMVKVPHLWDFFPPPPPSCPPPQIAHDVPILHMEFVLQEICHIGGRFAIWYYSPWGSSAMGFIPGGGG